MPISNKCMYSLWQKGELLQLANNWRKYKNILLENYIKEVIEYFKKTLKLDLILWMEGKVMSKACYKSKEFVSYNPGKEDEKALEKVYVYPELVYYEGTQGEAYKYDLQQVVKAAGAEGRITTRHRYSLVDKKYFIDSDGKGGRVYVKEEDVEA